MKRPNREVSIFTLSALDVLAMATGVFVLLLVMLMPYYRKTFDAQAAIEAVRVSVAQTMTEVQPLEQIATEVGAEARALAAEADRLEAAADALEEQIAKRPEKVEVKPTKADPENRVIEAIDLIFVIDTTASMTPVIRELAFSLRSIVRILERLVPSVRIGVAAYKDRDTGLAPVISLPLTTTTPHLPRIISFVESLNAAAVGSRTIEEDMHLGLESAMLMRLRPDARQALVVIGDAAVHKYLQEETLYRVRNFVNKNEERTVSSLFVTTPSSLSHGQRARPYFQQVARAGKGTFNDHTGSLIEGILLSVLVE